MDDLGGTPIFGNTHILGLVKISWRFIIVFDFDKDHHKDFS